VLRYQAKTLARSVSFPPRREAAAGYGRRAVRAALARLTKRGFVGRPPGTQRKGAAITAEGIAFLEAAKATSTR